VRLGAAAEIPDGSDDLATGGLGDLLVRRYHARAVVPRANLRSTGDGLRLAPACAQS
jgi:hypothetical protein